MIVNIEIKSADTIKINKLVTSLMPFISGKMIQGFEFNAWQAVEHSSTMTFGQEWAV